MAAAHRRCRPCGARQCMRPELGRLFEKGPAHCSKGRVHTASRLADPHPRATSSSSVCPPSSAAQGPQLRPALSAPCPTHTHTRSGVSSFLGARTQQLSVLAALVCRQELLATPGRCSPHLPLLLCATLCTACMHRSTQLAPRTPMPLQAPAAPGLLAPAAAGFGAAGHEPPLLPRLPPPPRSCACLPFTGAPGTAEPLPLLMSCTTRCSRSATSEERAACACAHTTTTRRAWVHSKKTSNLVCASLTLWSSERMSRIYSWVDASLNAKPRESTV